MSASAEIIRPGGVPPVAWLAPTRVLVPYISTYFGGVRRVLGDGLPRLASAPGLRITYAELCCNQPDMEAMEQSGVAVERALGVAGESALGRGGGIRRWAGIAAQVPRLARMTGRLAAHLGGYDVCYVHGHRELLIAIAAAALCGRDRAPALVWHWHGPPLSVGVGARGAWGARLVAALGSRACERVIAISSFSARLMREMGVRADRITTVLNAAEVGPAAPAGAPVQPLPAPVPGQVTLLLPCASLRPHKGVHVAVEALAHLPPNHVLWVTGDTADVVAAQYLGELRRLTAELKVGDRVHFIGARREVYAAMRAADAVLVPTISEEPFGLVAAEAQLLGVPVVGSSCGALPEILGDGAGALFEPGRPEALASAVAALTGDAQLRRRMVDAARARAERLFSYDRWSREMAVVLVEAGRAHRAG
jgi:glycosyltransferase involved in cell wall biosynthesis